MENRYEKECKECDKEFYSFRANQQYCSKYCREASFVKRQPKGYRRGIENVKHCPECNEKYETTDSRKIYCSRQCLWTFKNKIRPTTKEQKRECPQCNKVFMPMQRRGVGRKYCSSKCANKANYERNRTSIKKSQDGWNKKNRWNGNWYKALKRDKFTCQVCSIYLPPSKWSKIKRVIVHHIDGSGEEKYKNHDLDNLSTLCNKCHRLFHGIHLVSIDGIMFIKGKILNILGVKNISVLDG